MFLVSLALLLVPLLKVILCILAIYCAVYVVVYSWQEAEWHLVFNLIITILGILFVINIMFCLLFFGLQFLLALAILLV